MGFDSAIASCCLICLVLPTIVLQTCGVFSSSWIKHNNTSECYRGIISTRGCPYEVKSLGDTVLGLQMTSLAIIGLTTTSTIWFICCKHDDDEDNPEGCLILSGCMVCLYPVAGILGFSGCMVVIAEYGDHEKGWAFYLSLVASCYLILQMFVCFCAIGIYVRSEDKSGGDSQNEVTRCESNTESRGAVVGQVVEQHQIGVSETGEIIVRKLQFTRIFHIS